MAIDLPINAPLTDAQGELTAKIGSMKSLLALPSIRKRNIPKGNQISTYDYLLKILETMGLNPEVIFNAFLSKVFDQAGTFLEDKVLDAIGDSLGEQGIQLSPYTNNSNPTKDEKKAYKAANKSFLRSIIPNTFLQTVKQKLAKDLLVMIFGPKQATSTSLNTNQAEVDMLISNAVCGEGLFSLSNDPIVRNQDIEFNRIKLREQLEKGEVVYEISCQSVKIKLPADPGFIFNGGGQFTSSSSVVSPAQSLNFAVQYVNNQVQRINNESNANKGGKKFFQILIEKLLSFVSILVQPYLPSLFVTINSYLTPSQQVTMGNFVFDNCAIANDPENDSKKAFAKSLFNALLKELLKLLLLFVIKKFKQLVANYFARTALEKQKRKLEKAKLKFQVFSSLAEDADKIQKYAAALSTLSEVLGNIS
jgi:hypothetical protein